MAARRLEGSISPTPTPTPTPYSAARTTDTGVDVPEEASREAVSEASLEAVSEAESVSHLRVSGDAGEGEHLLVVDRSRGWSQAPSGDGARDELRDGARDGLGCMDARRDGFWDGLRDG